MSEHSSTPLCLPPAKSDDVNSDRKINEGLEVEGRQLSVVTDETDETDAIDPIHACDIDLQNISNDDFMEAIFDDIDLNLDGRPIVCSFAGDPKKHPSWRPQAWPCDTGNEKLNWYACPSDFAPDAAGGYRAKIMNARAVYCVMIDDLGSKVPLDCLPKSSFSWLLETSPGNFQAGFIFEKPVDKKTAESLKNAILEAGLSDTGNKGAAVRWMRLPKAINGKKEYGDPSPQCKLVIWQPGLRYSVESLATLLKLDLKDDKKATKKKSASLTNTFGGAWSNFGVYVPKSEENYVLIKLKDKGLYKQNLGSGKHDVTCPWVTEHTDQIDHGSCYFEPSDMSPIGGYKCQHSHGDQYRIGELLTFLGASTGQAKHKSEIYLRPGEIHRIVSASEKELALSGRYFQRGGLIVSVTTDPSSYQAIVKAVPSPALVNVLSEILTFYRRTQGGTYEVCDPPSRPITSLYDSERYIHLKSLVGLARQPHLRPDGSLVRNAGYDELTGLYGSFDASKYEIPEKPNKQDAEQALAELKGLLAEFNFATPQDEAAALAAMLTAVIRVSLPLAPMFHIKAPQIASGKSYLSSIIAKLASPSVTSAVSFPGDEEECRKLLLATLLESPAVVVFDNLNTDLVPYKSLCSAITEEHLTGRILGVSKTATVGTRALFLSSGNNVGPIRDMARRAITVLLDPKVETPSAREFKFDPLAQVNVKREYFVSLALTVVLARINSDDPYQQVKAFASFGQWSKWIRQTLLWLGHADPVSSIFDQLASDPDREALGRLLHAWNAVFGSSPTMVRDAVNRSSLDKTFLETEVSKELFESMLEIAEKSREINRRSLGRWIARHQGQIVDGLRFERAIGKTSSERWIVKSVKTVLSDEKLQETDLIIEKMQTIQV